MIFFMNVIVRHSYFMQPLCYSSHQNERRPVQRLVQISKLERTVAITRWDPYREVATLQNRLNSLFQDYNRNEGAADPVSAACLVPPVDIYHEDAHQDSC